MQGLVAVKALLRSRFARNWSVLVASSLACQGLGMLATMRIARRLAPDGYGRYNLIQTTAALGVVLAELGLRHVIIRECARRPERSAEIVLCSGVMRAIVLSVVGAGVFLYGSRTAGMTPAFGTITVALLLAMSIWNLSECVAFGHERMEYSSVLNLAGSTAWCAAACLVPSRLITTLNVSLAFALLQGAKALAYAMLALHAGYLKRGPGPIRWWRTGRQLLAQSLPFYWLALLTSVTNEVPILFLAERSRSAEVGLYNVGLRLVSPMNMLTTTALVALYPGLSRVGPTEGEQFVRVTQRALLSIVAVGTVGAATISLLRLELVSLLFGTAYSATADAMAFQCWYAVLLAVLSLIGTSLAARDRQKQLALLSTAYAIVATPILWWGAARGATGLALSILAAAILNMSYHWLAFQRSLPRPLSGSYSAALLLLLAAGMTFSWAVPQTWSVPARVLIALISLPVVSVLAISVRRPLKGARV